jgi:hypothetical protein
VGETCRKNTEIPLPVRNRSRNFILSYYVKTMQLAGFFRSLHVIDGILDRISAADVCRTLDSVFPLFYFAGIARAMLTAFHLPRLAGSFRRPVVRNHSRKFP